MLLRPLPHAAVRLRCHQTRYQIAGTHRAKQEALISLSSRLDVPRAWLGDRRADWERVFLAFTGKLSEHRRMREISAVIG